MGLIVTISYMHVSQFDHMHPPYFPLPPLLWSPFPSLVISLLLSCHLLSPEIPHMKGNMILIFLGLDYFA